MSFVNLRPPFFVRLCLCLALSCAPLAAVAQTAEEAFSRIRSSARTPDEAAIQKVFLKGYEAYAKRDGAALFSLFSEQSPYLPEFKLFLQQEFARNERVKIQSIRIIPVGYTQVEGDHATARVFIDIGALDADTGKPAEGFGEMEHTLRFIKEAGVWKVWQFVETAEELTRDLLAVATDEERARVLATKGEPFTGGLLNGLLNQAQALLEEKGNYEQAAVIYNVALHVAKQLNSPWGIGGATVGLGDVYSAQGDYLRAANNYQQIMKLAESLGSREGIAAVSVKMGNIHYQQGNYAQAMEYYQRSVKLYEELGSKVEIAYPLLSIGNAYFSLAEYAQALDYYQRSLKIYQQIYDKAGTAYLLNRIGDVYAAQGKHAEAIDNYQQSLKLHEALSNKAMAAYALNKIGDVRYAQGDYKEADALSTRAVELARINNSPEILWQSLTSAGRSSRALSQPERAGRAFSEAIAVIEQLRNRAVGPEQDRRLFFERRTAPYHALIDLLIAQNNFAEAFVYAERAKGRVLLDVLGRGRANIKGALTSDERTQEKRLNKTVVALNAQLKRETLRPQADTSRIAGIESQLRDARLEYDAFQTRIYAAHPELKIQRGEVEPLTLEGVAPLIPDTETALLEFTVTPEKVYLFVIAKSVETQINNHGGVEMKVYPLNVKLNELTNLTSKFRTRLAENTLNFRELARQLYDLLLRPAQAQINGKKILCIVPDGALWGLPFQALQPAENRYLLEDHALFYAPSLGVLRAMKARGTQSITALDTSQAAAPGASTIKIGARRLPTFRTLLAFGNPVLGKLVVAQARSLNRDGNLSALPEAEREVKSLTQFYNPAESKILTGGDAREETFKAEAGQYRVLHFATHGTFDDYNPMYSHLLLASTSADEDGFLEAREIINFNLKADLVVLSACQTARGRVGTGEGLIGMSWAFFVAGAPTTVDSQWKVDSASTTLLMANFHRLLAAQSASGTVRAGKAEALREAALKVLANPQYRHPFYWAGFVLVGDGN
ncbi:MAG: CHAT domain-containing protein [Pyrinomonadaceae bacterium]|nr:CHAT domain-containing protein [Pyrinomonadaceae bacterium]